MTTTHPLPAVDVLVHQSHPDLAVSATITETGGRIDARVDLRGVLCADTGPVLSQTVERLLVLGAANVRFDLAGLRVCTSDGIELWIELAGRLERAGGRLLLVNERYRVRRVLQAAGLPELARSMAP